MRTLTVLAILMLSLSASAEYSRYSRVENRGGTITFEPNDKGRILIKARDQYGERVISTPEGFSQLEVQNLLKNIPAGDRDLFCVPIRGVSKILDSVGGFVELSVAAGALEEMVHFGSGIAAEGAAAGVLILKYWAAKLVIGSFAEACREAKVLNAASSEVIRSVVEKFRDDKGGIEAPIEDRRKYWSLHDSIENYRNNLSMSRGLRKMVGGGNSSNSGL